MHVARSPWLGLLVMAVGLVTSPAPALAISDSIIPNVNDGFVYGVIIAFSVCCCGLSCRVYLAKKFFKPPPRPGPVKYLSNDVAELRYLTKHQTLASPPVEARDMLKADPGDAALKKLIKHHPGAERPPRFYSVKWIERPYKGKVDVGKDEETAMDKVTWGKVKEYDPMYGVQEDEIQMASVATVIGNQPMFYATGLPTKRDRTAYYEVVIDDIFETSERNRTAMEKLALVTGQIKAEDTTMEKDAVLAIGWATSPFAPFKMPGIGLHSLALHTDGRVRRSDYMPRTDPARNAHDGFRVCDRIRKGDVVGAGYQLMYTDEPFAKYKSVRKRENVQRAKEVSIVFFFTLNGRRLDHSDAYMLFPLSEVVATKNLAREGKAKYIEYNLPNAPHMLAAGCCYPAIGCDGDAKIRLNFGEAPDVHPLKWFDNTFAVHPGSDSSDTDFTTTDESGSENEEERRMRIAIKYPWRAHWGTAPENRKPKSEAANCCVKYTLAVVLMPCDIYKSIRSWCRYRKVQARAAAHKRRRKREEYRQRREAAKRVLQDPTHKVARYSRKERAKFYAEAFLYAMKAEDPLKEESERQWVERHKLYRRERAAAQAAADAKRAERERRRRRREAGLPEEGDGGADADDEAVEPVAEGFVVTVHESAADSGGADETKAADSAAESGQDASRIPGLGLARRPIDKPWKKLAGQLDVDPKDRRRRTKARGEDIRRRASESIPGPTSRVSPWTPQTQKARRRAKSLSVASSDSEFDSSDGEVSAHSRSRSGSRASVRSSRSRKSSRGNRSGSVSSSRSGPAARRQAAAERRRSSNASSASVSGASVASSVAGVSDAEDDGGPIGGPGGRRWSTGIDSGGEFSLAGAQQRRASKESRGRRRSAAETGVKYSLAKLGVKKELGKVFQDIEGAEALVLDAEAARTTLSKVKQAAPPGRSGIVIGDVDMEGAETLLDDGTVAELFGRLRAEDHGYDNIAARARKMVKHARKERRRQDRIMKKAMKAGTQW